MSSCSSSSSEEDDDQLPSTSSESSTNSQPRVVRKRIPNENKYFTQVGLKMPENGVLTEEGYLFHHVVPQTLKQQHVDRLLDYGIIFMHSQRFSAEEDRKIRQNWRKFAKQHGFVYEDAQYFAGFMASMKGQSREAQMKENDLLIKLGMWPAVCKHLEHRSAKQVRRRMLLIFDRNFVGSPDPMTEEQRLEAFGRFYHGEPILNIALDLKIPYIRLVSTLHVVRSTLHCRNIPLDEALKDPSCIGMPLLGSYSLRRLYLYVLQSLQMPADDVQKTYLSTRSMDFLVNMTQEFDFSLLTSRFHVNERVLRDSWKFLLTDLEREFNKNLDLFETEEMAWMEAVAEVMPIADKSLQTMISFLHCLRRSANKDAFVWNSNNFDHGKLSQKLVEHNLLDVLEVDNFELQKLPQYMTLRQAMKRKEKFLFSNLYVRLNLREKLEILQNCYKKLRYMPGFDSTDPTPSAINPHNFVECAIEVILRLEPEWKPPRILQRYVRSPHLVDLFTRKSNNDELLLPSKNQTILRMFLDEDYSCQGVSTGIARALEKRKLRENVSNQQNSPVCHLPKKRGWAGNRTREDVEEDPEHRPSTSKVSTSLNDFKTPRARTTSMRSNSSGNNLHKPIKLLNIISPVEEEAGEEDEEEEEEEQREEDVKKGLKKPVEDDDPLSDEPPLTPLPELEEQPDDLSACRLPTNFNLDTTKKVSEPEETAIFGWHDIIS